MLTFFYFTTASTTKLYTLSLHDALPIFRRVVVAARGVAEVGARRLVMDVEAVSGVRREGGEIDGDLQDRKSTRLNSSHVSISYAVFCLKKKKNMFTIKITQNYWLNMLVI